MAHGLTWALNQSVPHNSRTAQTMIQGRKAAHASPLVGFAFAAAGAGIVAAESSRPRSLGDSHSSFGCHTRRKPIRQAIERREAPMSTSQARRKLEIRSCG